MVEEVCGVPADSFLRIADAFCRASGPERTGAICYAVGLTQHSAGVQIIRTAAILQLLLGNIGRPGGGILALRGHASIQGSTDIPTLFDILPGYLPMPSFGANDATLDGYVGTHRSPAGWWANFDKYAVSLLKAWYGDQATAENEFGFGWLPRISGDHSHFGYWLDMADGQRARRRRSTDESARGTVRDGAEPGRRRAQRASRTARARQPRLAGRARHGRNRDGDVLAGLSGGANAASSGPRRSPPRCSSSPPPGTPRKRAASRTRSACCSGATRRSIRRVTRGAKPGSSTISAAASRRAPRATQASRNRGLNALTWDYPTAGPHGEPDIDVVLQEINGRSTVTGTLVDGFRSLAADGSTACGCWIYSGVYPSPDRNRARERNASGPYGHGWGFTWPADRRILYNRASARPDGTPWSERKKLVWWDALAHTWTGLDTPDFTIDKAPDYVPPPGATGDAALRGDAPFIMHDDGLGWIWVPAGLKDGPLPVHYEPLESPVSNRLYRQQVNPAADRKTRPDNAYAQSPGDPDYPYVLTTYRLTEHHTAGGMSRTLSHLAELQPELFCEISPALAREVGVENGEWVRVSTPRGAIEARALVTPRLQPLTVQGRLVHQVGLPYHFGGRGLVRGDVVNDLVAISEEPNVRIMEAKGLLCSVTARDPCR